MTGALLIAAALSSAWAGVEGAVHRGSWTPDRVTWSSTYRLHDTDRIGLAVPLPSGSRLVQATPHATAVLDPDGRIAALQFPAGTGWARVTTEQPADDEVLSPPLASDPALQRVILEQAHFEPAADLDLVKHVRYWAPAATTRSDRRALEALGDGRARTREQAVYLRAGPELLAAGGLAGAVRPPGAVPLRVTLGFGAVFALGVVGAVVGYRALDSFARRERTEHYIQHHLGQGGG